MKGLFPNRDRPFFFFDFSTGPTMRMLDGGLGGVGFGCSSFFGGSYVSDFLLGNIFLNLRLLRQTYRNLYLLGNWNLLGRLLIQIGS